jgi:hypothetical protein
VDDLVDRSRKTSEQFIDTVRREVASQLSKIDAKALENLANQVSDILKRSADAGRAATKDATSRASKEAAKAGKAGRDAAEKGRQAAQNVMPKVGKKKSAAKKSSSKKSAATKKSSSKKAPANKANKANKKAAS